MNTTEINTATPNVTEININQQRTEIVDNVLVVAAKKGDKGEAGTSLIVGDFVALESIKKGQLVYVSRSNGQVEPVNNSV